MVASQGKQKLLQICSEEREPLEDSVLMCTAKRTLTRIPINACPNL